MNSQPRLRSVPPPKLTSDEEFEAGDAIHITFQGRTVRGSVLIASANSRSLMIVFECLLGGYAGMMPVLREKDHGDYKDLLNQRPVVITHLKLCPHGRARICEECG